MESAQDYFGPPCIQKVATFAEVTCTFYEASRAKAHGPATIFSSQAIKHQMGRAAYFRKRAKHVMTRAYGHGSDEKASL